MCEYVYMYCKANVFVGQMFLPANCFFFFFFFFFVCFVFTSYKLQALLNSGSQDDLSHSVTSPLGSHCFVITKTMLYQLDNLLATVSK